MNTTPKPQWYQDNDGYWRYRTHPDPRVGNAHHKGAIHQMRNDPLWYWGAFQDFSTPGAANKIGTSDTFEEAKEQVEQWYQRFTSLPELDGISEATQEQKTATAFVLNLQEHDRWLALVAFYRDELARDQNFFAQILSRESERQARRRNTQAATELPLLLEELKLELVVR